MPRPTPASIQTATTLMSLTRNCQQAWSRQTSALWLKSRKSLKRMQPRARIASLAFSVEVVPQLLVALGAIGRLSSTIRSSQQPTLTRCSANGRKMSRTQKRRPKMTLRSQYLTVKIKRRLLWVTCVREKSKDSSKDMRRVSCRLNVQCKGLFHSQRRLKRRLT